MSGPLFALALRLAEWLCMLVAFALLVLAAWCAVYAGAWFTSGGLDDFVRAHPRWWVAGSLVVGLLVGYRIGAAVVTAHWLAVCRRLRKALGIGTPADYLRPD